MKKLNDLEYLRLGRFDRTRYKILTFISAIPDWLLGLVISAWRLIKRLGRAIYNELRDIGDTFKRGSGATRASYFIMGYGSLARGQILRGMLFLLFEVVFVGYMVLAGGHWLSKFGTLGTVGSHLEYDPVYDTQILVRGDDSFKILLYGLITIFFVIAFIYTWRLNVKQNRISEEILASGKRLKSGKDDLRSLVDDGFHKTMLALPLTGIAVFTIMPIVFMVLVAFTNYDGAHDGYNNLFTWVGLDNFNELFSGSNASGGGNLRYTFGEILTWTLIWAFFATFTNYFLGMFVAIMINKRGIRLKRLWRGILVLTIAIPQFVSLLYVSRMFANNGIVNGMLINMGWITEPIMFWKDPTLARIMVIIINIWIGIPYLMLIATGILMNVPQDLYESARIDGATGLQQYRRITFPYMLFVTGPYLLTSFIANINNFNIIYLLTNGQAVDDPNLMVNGVSANNVDLLITWLFKITSGSNSSGGSNYKLAAVIGIMIFLVISSISLIVYNVMPSIRNEEDYQ